MRKIHNLSKNLSAAASPGVEQVSGDAPPPISILAGAENVIMAKYMLMLLDNPMDYAGMTPSQLQEMVKEYGVWAQTLAKQGKLVGGEKLADEGGKVIRGKAPKSTVTDGPFAETKEVLGGYFIVQAASYDEAVQIAMSCPHVKYGAATHVRRIDELS